MRYEKDKIDKGLVYFAWFITFMWLFLIAGNVYGYDENGDGYGIGADTKYSILDLVEMIAGKPDMQPAKPGNRMDGELKTDKLKELGWNAKVNLKEYIREEFYNAIREG